MLDLLRAYYGLLSPLLDCVGCAPLPDGPVQRASSLHQRAWLLQVRTAPAGAGSGPAGLLLSRTGASVSMATERAGVQAFPAGQPTRPTRIHAPAPLPAQLHALELHRADVALSQHGESVGGLLGALFGAEAPGDAAGARRRRARPLLRCRPAAPHAAQPHRAAPCARSAARPAVLTLSEAMPIPPALPTQQVWARAAPACWICSTWRPPPRRRSRSWAAMRTPR